LLPFRNVGFVGIDLDYGTTKNHPTQQNSTLLNIFATRKLKCLSQKQYLKVTTKQKETINQSITTVQFATSVQKIKIKLLCM